MSRESSLKRKVVPILLFGEFTATSSHDQLPQDRDCCDYRSSRNPKVIQPDIRSGPLLENCRQIHLNRPIIRANASGIFVMPTGVKMSPLNDLATEMSWGVSHANISTFDLSLDIAMRCSG